MGFAEECSLGSSMASHTGEETSYTKPSFKLQTFLDHGNQPKGLSYLFIY